MATETDERLRELQNLDQDWDAGMFCQHSDPSFPHEFPPSGPVSQVTTEHGRALIAAVGHEPYSISPISAMPDTGACLQVEWRGAHDHIAVEVGPDGVYGWLLIVDANQKDQRRFYESNHADLSDMIRFAKTVMGDGAGI